MKDGRRHIGDAASKSHASILTFVKDQLCSLTSASAFKALNRQFVSDNQNLIVLQINYQLKIILLPLVTVQNATAFHFSISEFSMQ